MESLEHSVGNIRKVDGIERVNGTDDDLLLEGWVVFLLLL